MESPSRYMLPPYLSEEIKEMRLRGLVALKSEDPKLAIKIFEEIYVKLLKSQEKAKRSFHKGDVLYNLGSAFLYLEQYNEAIKNFLLAYIEDTLSSYYDLEDNADRAPAAQMLRDVFIIDLRIFREIKIIAHKSKSVSPPQIPFNPEEILHAVGKILKIDLENLAKLASRLPKFGKPVLGFPQPRELRVFIGTNYDVNIGIIPLVKDGIQLKNQRDNANYIGVAVLDLNVPPDDIHDVCLALLHTCYFAVIDVSHPGGQFNEIERIRDYGIPEKNVILLRQSGKDPNHKPHVSAMIKTLGYKIMEYYDPREIIGITQRFLP